MKTSFRVLISILMIIGVGCAKQPSSPAAAALAAPATIKDIMDSMVDPSGDFMFEAIQEIADEQGVRKKAPETDDDWTEVRRHAMVLIEAPNLLTMDGRRVARAGEKADNPQVELQPEEIQKLIDADRPAFMRRAKRLQDAAAAALTAAESKNQDALFTAIDSIDKACENCHLHYWYPNDQAAQEAAKQSGLVID
jgi:hypothetical protein